MKVLLDPDLDKVHVKYLIEPEVNPQDLKLLRGLERKVYNYVKKHEPCTVTSVMREYPHFNVKDTLKRLEYKYLIYPVFADTDESKKILENDKRLGNVT